MSASAREVFIEAQRLLGQRAVEEAIRQFDLAEELGHDRNECSAGRWNCWMLLGGFECAWKESDGIVARGLPDPNRFWDGSPWAERRLMLRCLHGLGDTIQFIRYAPLLRQTCSSLTVQTHPELVRLVQAVAGVDSVKTWTNDDSNWDMQMEITELPFAFRTVEASIPASIPYINISARDLAWASGLVGKTGLQKVGLIWQAGPFNPARSIPLKLLEAISAVRNFEFYSFQKGVSAASLASFPSINNLAPYSADVLDTAALMSQMDLIISVDTMTAHLAGALNLPVWILLPAAADWRWMLGRTDSPWYPSAHLLRQPAPGHWLPVIEEIQARLKQMQETPAHSFRL